MQFSIDQFFQLSTELLSIRSQEGYFLELNDQWTKVFGWSLAQLKERPWLDFVHPNDIETSYNADFQCLTSQGTTIVPLTNRFRCRDGSYRWLSWQLASYNEGFSYAISKDITQNSWQGSKIYRSAIQNALKLRDQAIAASSVGIVISDVKLPDMPLIYVNKAFERITGYSETEVLGYNCRFLHGDKTSQPGLDQLRQAIKEGKNCTVTLLNYRKDGTPFWNELSISPIYDDKQELTHFVGVQSDITERLANQEALMLRDKAIAASCVGIVIADVRLPDMPLIYINHAFEMITGYSAAETLGSNCRFLQGKNTSQTELNKLRQAIKKGTDCQVTLLNYRKDGTPFWNQLIISPVYDQDHQLTHFVGIQSDISDRIKAEEALRLEKTKTERLLLNILPKPIVQQLKNFQGTVAQQFNDVTILFADLVGFTPLSATMQPLELVSLLNQIFSIFDQITEKHGVEKIKTIGDAYMAAAGLPIPKKDHASAIANMALEIQQEIALFNTTHNISLSIRMGINTGSVVAGVIGKKKFIYDLWGDAVNTASRMESHGIPGAIQVTSSTYELLKNDYLFQERGTIEIKGKGMMTTYLLVGHKSQHIQQS